MEGDRTDPGLLLMNTGSPVRPIPYPSSRNWLPVSDTCFPSFVSLFLWTRLLSLPQPIVRHTHGLRQSCTAGYPTPHYPRDDVPSAPISRHSLLNSSCKNSPVLMVPRCSSPPSFSLSHRRPCQVSAALVSPPSRATCQRPTWP